MNTEIDPYGKNPNELGSKLDFGKNRIGLTIQGFARALKEVSLVTTFGADKYTEYGWITVPRGIDRYTDAMFRHLIQEFVGETHDKDSQLLHAAHTAWNALARLDLILRENTNGENNKK